MFHFLQSEVNLIHFICHSPSRSRLHYLVALKLHCYSTLLSVSFFNQSRLWILTTYKTLDKVLILDRLDRYSLLEAELRWFYCSLFLYIKQEMQQWGITFYETKLATNKRKL